MWREREEGGGVWRECEEGGGVLVVESARLEEDCSVYMYIMYFYLNYDHQYMCTSTITSIHTLVHNNYTQVVVVTLGNSIAVLSGSLLSCSGL